MAKLNLTYLRSADFRARVLQAHGKTTHDISSDKVGVNETELAPAEARVFAGLNDSTLGLSTFTPSTATPTHVNLVLPEFRTHTVFAGVTTAIWAAIGLGKRLGLPVRVIAMARNQDTPDIAKGREFLREKFDLDAEIILRGGIPTTRFNPQDRWIATHWTTAHALDVAAHAGLVDPASVVYLIQDYEPGFAPWSTSYTTARSTYHAGFIPLVNSRPLLQHLETVESVGVDERHVFAPAFDLAQLQEVAAHRSRSDRTTVLFYGRPSKPRNLFHLGVTAMRQAVRLLGDDAAGVDFVSAGEKHRAIDLGSGRRLSPLGRMAWDDYFAFLPTANVVLSLQMSPHPSHPPLESAISGAHVVTNDFFGTRVGVHERITAVPESPDTLGEALAQAVRLERSSGPGGYAPLAAADIGGELDSALDAIAPLVARE
jgi:hypothetical protein